MQRKDGKRKNKNKTELLFISPQRRSSTYSPPSPLATASSECRRGECNRHKNNNNFNGKLNTFKRLIITGLQNMRFPFPSIFPLEREPPTHTSWHTAGRVSPSPPHHNTFKFKLPPTFAYQEPQAAAAEEAAMYSERFIYCLPAASGAAATNKRTNRKAAQSERERAKRARW